MRNTNK